MPGQPSDATALRKKNGSAPSIGTRTTINALESRFEWKETPSTLAVVLAQEDLWVIEALLRVIANTNEGATYATAAVKQIEALQIGKDAVGGRQGEEGIFRAGPAAARSRRNAPRRPGRRQTEHGRARRSRRRRGRAKTKDSSRTATSTTRASRCRPSRVSLRQAPYAEFKMMPIRMNLVMDQRRLPKLLVECANSNMPIEVQARPHPQEPGQHARFGVGGGRAGPAMGGPRGGGFRGPAGPPGFERGGRAARTATDKQETRNL